MRPTIFTLISVFSALASAMSIPARRQAPATKPNISIPPALANIPQAPEVKFPTQQSRRGRRQFHNADFGSSGSPPSSDIEPAAVASGSNDPETQAQASSSGPQS